MDTLKLEEAGIDWEDGVRRCANNSGLYERLLNMFAQDSNYADALTAYENEDWGAMFSHMHEIKGMSSNLSMTDVYANAAEIVAMLRAEDYNAIGAVLEQFKDAYSKAIQAIGA